MQVLHHHSEFNWFTFKEYIIYVTINFFFLQQVLIRLMKITLNLFCCPALLIKLIYFNTTAECSEQCISVVGLVQYNYPKNYNYNLQNIKDLVHAFMVKCALLTIISENEAQIAHLLQQ